MSDSTPDRLKTFRAQRTPPGQASNGLLWLIFALALVSAALLAFLAYQALRPSGEGGARIPGGMTGEKLRGYARHLEERNLLPAAISAYEQYLALADLSDEQRANVSYTAAKLAIREQQYERALAFLYQAEFLDPESALKDEIDKKIVLCLDKLGRSVDLRQELRARSAVKPGPDAVREGDVILADLGDEVITRHELEEAIEALPGYMRETVLKPEQKTEFLRNMVAERLLVDKARRLELDKAPDIQDKLVEQLDSMIVRKLIEDEVARNLRITDADVERFYRAEPDRFTLPATAEVSIINGEDEDAVARALLDSSRKPEVVTVRRGVTRRPPFDREEVQQAIFALKEGEATQPTEVGGVWYVFLVEGKTPERTPPFEEVADRARQLYEAQKQQEYVQGLIAETLEARNVKLYPERLKEDATE